MKLFDIPIEKNEKMIEVVRNKIASLPCDTDQRVKAKDQKLLGLGQDLYERQLEFRRMEATTTNHEEQHPPNKIECPICLEDVKVISKYSAQYFTCCGKSMCVPCGQSEGGLELKTCPLCRAPQMDMFTECGIKQLEKSAERGIAVAQTLLGLHYLGLTQSSKKGSAINIEEGIRLVQLAAEQNEPAALLNLSMNHQMGMYGFERSSTIANEILARAAETGYCEAQTCLAYAHSEKGDYTMAVHYATLASRSINCHENVRHPTALLGKLFYLGVGGLEKNLFRAKIYLETAEKSGSGNMTDHLILAETLLELSEQQYGTMYPPAGYSSIPRVFYLLHKAVDHNETVSATKEVIKKLKLSLHNKCANCEQDAENMLTKKLKQCAVCEAVSYCCKECQVEHWKGGHKIDCVKKYQPRKGISRYLPPGIDSLENVTILGPGGEQIKKNRMDMSS